MENSIFLICDCCGNPIFYGKKFISITRSEEIATHSVVTGTDESDVLSISALLTLCEKCGKTYNTGFFELIVNAIPFKAKRVCEN